MFFRNAKNSLVRVKYSGSHRLPAPSLVDVVVFVKHIILENDEKSRSVSFGLLPNILNLKYVCFHIHIYVHGKIFLTCEINRSDN